MEIIEICGSTQLLCREIEYAHTLATEVWPIKEHGQFIAYIIPLFTIDAIREACLVPTVLEIKMNFQQYSLACHLHFFYNVAVSIILCHGAPHDNISCSAFLLHTYISVSVLESGKTGTVTILHAGYVKPCLCSTLR